MNIKWPDQAQVYAFTRHIASAVGGGVAVLSFMHLWQNPGDAAEAQKAFGMISSGMVQIYTGIGILVPIGMGVIAAMKANPILQMIIGASSILKGHGDVTKLTVADQKTIAKATETLPVVETVTVTPAKGL